jgi:predicted permease
MRAFYSSLFSDIRISLRQLRRSPMFALTTVLTLTVTIAANVVVYGVVNGLILHPLPVPQPEQIYQIQGHQSDDLTFSYLNYRDIRDRNRSFSSVALFRPARVGVAGPAAEPAQPVWAYEATGNYFSTLGIQPLLGRFFTPADDVSNNASHVVVLSYDCWRVRFNADPNLIGKTIEINKHPYTVVAVAPENFTGTERFLWVELWIPYHNLPEIEGFDMLQARGNSGSWMVGRLKPGLEEAQANADLTRVAGQMAKEFSKEDGNLTLRVARPGLLGDMLGGPIRIFLAGIMAMSALVLLAACANLGVLFSSRTADRAKELGIRIAIGSSRGRILRQLLTESVVVALMGGILASLGSALLLDALTRWRPAFGELPIHFLVRPDTTVYLVSVLLALVTGILFGILPARQIWRTDPNATLRSAGSTAAGGSSLFRSTLLCIQIALCCLLVTASFVSLRGLERAFHMSYGFKPEGVTIASFNVHMAGYGDTQLAGIQQRLLEAAQAIPSVDSAAYSDSIPLSVNQSTTSIYPPGTTDFSAANVRFGANYFEVSPTYFSTTGTRLLSGRAFTEHDTADAPSVAIVNQTFARKLFGTENAVGLRYPTRQGKTVEVVGVVEDGKYLALTEDPKPAVFWPSLQSPDSDTVLLVRSSRSPSEVAVALRRAIAQVDPGLPIFNLSSWPDALGLVTFPARAATIALGFLGGLAALLAVTGIFGTASYTVSRRIRELGIRVALGAQVQQVLRAALGHVLLLLTVGSTIGLLLGFAAAKLLAGIVYQANVSDPLVLIGVGLTMAALGLAAAALPAHRAIRVDPAVLLREK